MFDENVNKERIKLWIEALRSGKYKQGTHTLHRVENNEDTWCCLGVGCDVAIKNGVQMVEEFNDASNTIMYDGIANMFPSTVKSWFGTVGNPVLFHDKNIGIISCIMANDRLGWDFNKIADALEKFYLNKE